jgi:hypothetical protein
MSTPTISPLSLLTEQGEFFLDNLTSNYITFAFRGDNSFITRVENFLHNYGALEHGEIHKLTDNFFYALAPLARLKQALTESFRGEIIQSKTSEIHYIVEDIKDEEGDVIDFTIEWDETKLMELANAKTEEFLTNKAQRITLNVYTENHGAVLDEFGLGKMVGAVE